MSKPSAQSGPPGPHRSTADGSTSQTRAVVVTLATLGVWAALTLAAPLLAQPVSGVVQVIWSALGLDVVVAKEDE